MEDVNELDPEGCGEDYDFRPWRRYLYGSLLPMEGCTAVLGVYCTESSVTFESRGDLRWGEEDAGWVVWNGARKSVSMQTPLDERNENSMHWPPQSA